MHTVVISVQHSEDISLLDMRVQLKEVVVEVRMGGGGDGKMGILPMLSITFDVIEFIWFLLYVLDGHMWLVQKLCLIDYAALFFS